MTKQQSPILLCWANRAMAMAVATVICRYTWPKATPILALAFVITLAIALAVAHFNYEHASSDEPTK